MKMSEKKKFIQDLCDYVRDTTVEKVGNMPEEWTGHELRRYLADKFEEQTTTTMRDSHSARMKDYRNTIATTNL